MGFLERSLRLLIKKIYTFCELFIKFKKFPEKFAMIKGRKFFYKKMKPFLLSIRTIV